MSSTVIVNMRTVVHAGSTGQAIAAAPDFCKTPTPGGPVPMPYPNIEQSNSTTKGSTTVKMDGKPIMLKNSEFSFSQGDEGGNAGGGVASNVFKGKAKFIIYSFDVKVNGKNVPRLADPMTMNGNAPNTMTPAETQAAAAALGMTVTEFKLICGAFCEAQREYDRGNIKGRGCISKEFEKRIKNHIQKGRLPSNTLTEATFLIPKRGPAQLVTGAVFLAHKVAGAVKPWAQAAVNAVTAATGPVGPMAGNALSGMLKSVGSSNRVCRPDLVLQDAAGNRRCYDAKGEWKGGKDKWKDGQRADQRRIDSEGKPKQLNKNSCKC